MIKEPIISYRVAKNSIYFCMGFITSIVMMVFVSFPSETFASDAEVLLQMDVAAKEPENSITPEPETAASSINERVLITSLMQDVIIHSEDEPKAGWRKVHMCVTGYCPCSQCCGEFSDGITANNHQIQPGDTFIAADKSYPFGTEMIIPGYNSSKSVLVMDRGGAIKGDHIDAFFHTHQEALEWGVQYLDVLVKTQ